MSLTNAEQAFISQEQEKQDRELLLALRMVKEKGRSPSRWMRDALELWGYMVFAGPRPEIDMPYNCERLTPQGEEELVALEEKEKTNA